MAGPRASAQYEAVKSRIAEGLSVKDAVAATAAEMDMTVGSVQTAYYRTLKELQKPGATSRTGEPTSEELLRQAVEALTLLARRAEGQEKDLERLRRIERALTDT